MKHHSKSKVGRRRAHLALKPAALFVCPNCSYPILPHKICTNCGYYKGRLVKKQKLKVKR